MKGHSAISFTLLIFIPALSALRVAGQTLNVLYGFSTSPPGLGTNADGAFPYGPLIASKGALYGIADDGGTGGNGTVFRVNVDATGFTNLHNFAAGAGPQRNNNDGANPAVGLAVSGSRLFGTTDYGGPDGSGTVFGIDTNGTAFSTLHSFTATSSARPFTNSDGAYPDAGLTVAGNVLYGMTHIGGSAGNGTIFAVTMDGNSFTLLHTFSTGTGAFPSITNTDGAGPYSRLALSGNTLYGTTESGGAFAKGTIFALNTNGSGFVTLHEFSPMVGTLLTNEDGAYPSAGLALAGNILYGTTPSGGSSGSGTLFSVRIDGSGFTVLHSFTSMSGTAQTNADGAYPVCPLVVSGNTIYGTADSGGAGGTGTIFALNTDGGGFRTLYSFSPYGAPSYTNSDGGNPDTGVTLIGDTLYGAASSGGTAGRGTLFALALTFSPPVLTITSSPGGIELSWPVSAIGFNLESANALLNPVWGPVSAAPVLLGGQNVITNVAAGASRFFRLKH